MADKKKEVKKETKKPVKKAEKKEEKKVAKKANKKTEKKDVDVVEIYDKIGRILLVTLLIVILTFLFSVASIFRQINPRYKIKSDRYKIIIIDDTQKGNNVKVE